MYDSIEITQDDIDNGVQDAATQCPLALAIKRKYPHYNVVYVYANTGRAVDLVPHNFAPGRDAYHFIRRFDDYGKEYVEPQTVHITWRGRP